MNVYIYRKPQIVSIYITQVIHMNISIYKYLNNRIIEQP